MFYGVSNVWLCEGKTFIATVEYCEVPWGGPWHLFGGVESKEFAVRLHEKQLEEHLIKLGEEYGTGLMDGLKLLIEEVKSDMV